MRLHTVRRDRQGQAIVDYAMIVALVGVCLIAILGLVGNVTRKVFTVTTTTVVRQAGPPPAGGGAVGVPAIPASAPGDSDPDDGREDPDSLITESMQ